MLKLSVQSAIVKIESINTCFIHIFMSNKMNYLVVGNIYIILKKKDYEKTAMHNSVTF